MVDDCEACRTLSTGFLGGFGGYLLWLRRQPGVKSPRMCSVLGTALLILAPVNYWYRMKSTVSKSTSPP